MGMGTWAALVSSSPPLPRSPFFGTVSACDCCLLQGKHTTDFTGLVRSTSFPGCHPFLAISLKSGIMPKENRAYKSNFYGIDGRVYG